MKKQSQNRKIVDEMDDEDFMTPDMCMKMVEDKRKENEKHFFQMGFLYAHALFRHMAKQLESDEEKYVVVMNRYLRDIHENNFEDDSYRNGYITMEEAADMVISEYSLCCEADEDDA